MVWIPRRSGAIAISGVLFLASPVLAENPQETGGASPLDKIQALPKAGSTTRVGVELPGGDDVVGSVPLQPAPVALPPPRTQPRAAAPVLADSAPDAQRMTVSASPDGYASHRRLRVKHNGEYKVTLSSVDANRITLVGDRVKNVVLTEGRADFTADSQTGDIYLTLAAETDATVVNLLTEKGNVYKLLITAQGVPGATIVMDNPDLAPGPAGAVASSEHQTDVTSLIRIMAIASPGEGFEVRAAEELVTLPRGVQGLIVSEYVGARLRGAKIMLRPVANEPIQLSERDFYGVGGKVLGVWLPDGLVSPGKPTAAFVVYGRE